MICHISYCHFMQLDDTKVRFFNCNLRANFVCLTLQLIKLHYNRLCFPGFCNVYNTKEIEQNASAFDRNNRKLFPNVERKSHADKFNSILPPPNVTGNLHLGHAMMITVLDVICRWKHLNGYDVQLVPGLDHAGIATQVVVEQQLKKELGLSRFDIGKDAFIGKVLKWKDEKGISTKHFVFQSHNMRYLLIIW